jgi:hypothetical protein
LPIDEVVGMLGQPRPAGAGGGRPAARGPGGNRLVLDGEVLADVGRGAARRRRRRWSCRRVLPGEPMIVTSGERNVLAELAGRPAIDRLEEIAHAAVLTSGPLAQGRTWARGRRAPHDLGRATSWCAT